MSNLQNIYNRYGYLLTSTDNGFQDIIIYTYYCISLEFEGHPFINILQVHIKEVDQNVSLLGSLLSICHIFVGLTGVSTFIQQGGLSIGSLHKWSFLQYYNIMAPYGCRTRGHSIRILKKSKQAKSCHTGNKCFIGLASVLI